MVLIAHDHMKHMFADILMEQGMANEDAITCADIFTTNSLEGIYTHGVNRFSRFIQYIQEGHIDINARPKIKHTINALEQWDGQSGPGPLNALIATNRAIELAKQHTIGCVALANTNHWMRGGYYAWHAAKQNCILIAWTNTIANMPAWGATDMRLGNNPLVMGIPYQNEAIVLDMAMSQFSHGKLEMQARQHKPLPVAGGFDEEGNPTTDAHAILQSNRMMPVGFWKGSGLSLLLDLLAMILSGGKSAKEISDTKAEKGLSQIFIAINIEQLKNFPSIADQIEVVINDYLASIPASDKGNIVYPGQRVMATRNENLAKGIPVEESIWNEILALKR